MNEDQFAWEEFAAASMEASWKMEGMNMSLKQMTAKTSQLADALRRQPWLLSPYTIQEMEP